MAQRGHSVELIGILDSVAARVAEEANAIAEDTADPTVLFSHKKGHRAAGLTPGSLRNVTISS